jgi:hypothetical protein
MLGGQKSAQIRSAIARLRGHAGFWLGALSQLTIDLTLCTHAGLRTRIVESPGLSLSEAELDALVSQLRVVAGKTLPQESLSYGIFRRARAAVARHRHPDVRGGHGPSDRIQCPVGDAGRTRW